MAKLKEALKVVLAFVLLCGGCALPVPKTVVRFNPKTHALDIRSPKNINITNILVTTRGKDFTLSIGNYTSENSLEVVRAAMEAQSNQINGTLDGTRIILNAIGEAAK